MSETLNDSVSPYLSLFRCSILQWGVIVEKQGVEVTGRLTTAVTFSMDLR